MYSNMNKRSSMMLSLMMLLLVAATTTLFVAGQGTSALRMQAARQKKCGKCKKPDMKMLASLAKNKQVADTFRALYSSSDIADMKNEIASVYETDIGISNGDDELEAAAVALFTSSQKKLQVSLQDSKQGPLGNIVTIGNIILTVLGALSAILGIITPDSEILTLLGTITTILSIVIGVLDFLTGFLGGASASSSKEMAQFQSTFSDILCTARSLLCQVNILVEQSS